MKLILIFSLLAVALAAQTTNFGPTSPYSYYSNDQGGIAYQTYGPWIGAQASCWAPHSGTQVGSSVRFWGGCGPGYGSMTATQNSGATHQIDPSIINEIWVSGQLWDQGGNNTVGNYGGEADCDNNPNGQVQQWNYGC